MNKKNYPKNLMLAFLAVGAIGMSAKAQVRSSTADYPEVVKFSGSQSSANGAVYEVLPGPSVINPAMNPTPFSDSITMTTGAYSIEVEDVVDVDSPSSQDSVKSVNITFTGNDGQKYKIDNIMIIHKPDGAGDHTFFGGIGLNKEMHGNTTIGTNLMPKMTAYITLWGLVDLKDAVMDTVIAANRIIHMMVATNVRNDALKMDTNVVTDGSDYNVRNAHTHVILPPLDMAGNMSPVPGTDHGFIHVMFEKPLLTNNDKDWTKVYEVLPGPAVMNPAMNPTPFSDNVGIGEGTYSISVIDLDSVDSPTSRDSVLNVDIQYQRPNGEKFVIDQIMIIHKPDGAGDHPFFGGVGYDVLMHGNTTIGTNLMPKMTSYITIWGITDLKDGDGNVLASNRIIHMMVATRVRTADLRMIGSADIDSSDYDPARRETHIILPPLDMAGNMDPVPGTRHGFLHLMFENVSLTDSTVITSVQNISVDDIKVRAYPNPFSSSTTIEYQIDHQADVQLTIYDITGRIVERPVSRTQAQGTYRINFDGESLPAGVYFYELSIAGSRSIGKMSLIK